MRRHIHRLRLRQQVGRRVLAVCVVCRRLVVANTKSITRKGEA